MKTDWVEKHFKDDGIRVIESNEDILLYDTGHIPGAVHIDLAGRSSGSADSRLYFARKICAALQPSRHHAGHHLHFLRRRVRFQNTRRQSMPWKAATNDDTTFKPASELSKIYFEQCGVSPDKDTVVYCRIGERSSHTWFVLTYLLSLNNVRSGPFSRLYFSRDDTRRIFFRIETTASLPPGTVQGQERLDSIERWDSFAVVEFMSMAEEKLGVQLEPAQIAACRQISDLAVLCGFKP